MSRRTAIEATTTVALAVMLAAACTGGSSGSEAKRKVTPTTLAPTPTRQVTIHPVSVLPRASAGTTPVEVSLRPSINGKLGVTFVESGVGGTGKQWEAAGWNAVTVASLLMGAPLDNREFQFRVAGRLDGQGAGALMAIAVIALIRGDQLRPGITVTGTINPDGSIGPVSGVPGKIPGLRVIEAPDIYDAYRQFTGESLPQLPASSDTELNQSAYDKLHAKVETWIAKFGSARSDFRTLAPSVQQDLDPYASSAQREEQQAKTLTDDGLDAGAFSAAVNAAALMRAIAETGASFPILLTQGVAPFVNKIKASVSIDGEISGLADTLETFSPRSVSDASALLAAYGNAIDAVSLSRFAEHLFDAKAPGGQQDLSQVAEGAVYYELAASLVDAAGDLLAVGQGLGGHNVAPNAKVSEIAETLRSAAKANLASFQSVVIVPRAVATRVSVGAAEDTFAQADTVYALARTAERVLESLPSSFGSRSSSAYAALSGAISFYVRTAELNAKYSSLGVVDPETLQLLRFTSGSSFTSVIQRAQSQLASNIALLRSEHVNPTIVAADNEIAGIEQNRDASHKFDALGDYWDGYVNSRVLAYLGGFAAPR